MKKLDAGQKPDTLRRETTQDGGRELTERELNAVAGGPGPPGTAGDGNGRVAWISAAGLV